MRDFMRKVVRTPYFLLAGLVFIAYSFSFWGVFLEDDLPSIVEKSDISVFFRYSIIYPTEFFNWLGFKLSGYNVWGQHLVSVILHLTVVLLFFQFLQKFFNKRAALWGTAIYAVLPCLTEAVTWISGRVYILLGLFTLMPYLLYSKIAYQRFRLDYYLLAFWLYLYFLFFSQQVAAFYVIFPFWIILSDYYFKREISIKDWLLKFPFFIVTVWRLFLGLPQVGAKIHSLMGKGFGEILLTDELQLWWVTAIYSIFTNFKNMVWPVRMAYFRDPLIISKSTAYIYIVFLGGLFFLLYLYDNKRQRKPFSRLWWVAFIFLTGLLPTLFPVQISLITADRYLYLSAMAFGFLMAFSYEKLKFCPSQRYIIFALLLTFYLFITIGRNFDYHSAEQFWARDVLVSPDSFKTHNNYGVALYYSGKYAEAAKEFQKALLLNKNKKEILDNLAMAYNAQGQILKAVQYRAKEKKWEIFSVPLR